MFSIGDTSGVQTNGSDGNPSTTSSVQGQLDGMSKTGNDLPESQKAAAKVVEVTQGSETVIKTGADSAGSSGGGDDDGAGSKQSPGSSTSGESGSDASDEERAAAVEAAAAEAKADLVSDDLEEGEAAPEDNQSVWEKINPFAVNEDARTGAKLIQLKVPSALSDITNSQLDQAYAKQAMTAREFKKQFCDRNPYPECFACKFSRSTIDINANDLKRLFDMLKYTIEALMKGMTNWAEQILNCPGQLNAMLGQSLGPLGAIVGPAAAYSVIGLTAVRGALHSYKNVTEAFQQTDFKAELKRALAPALKSGGGGNAFTSLMNDITNTLGIDDIREMMHSNTSKDKKTAFPKASASNNKKSSVVRDATSGSRSPTTLSIQKADNASKKTSLIPSASSAGGSGVSIVDTSPTIVDVKNVPGSDSFISDAKTNIDGVVTGDGTAATGTGDGTLTAGGVDLSKGGLLDPAAAGSVTGSANVAADCGVNVNKGVDPDTQFLIPNQNLDPDKKYCIMDSNGEMIPIDVPLGADMTQLGIETGGIYENVSAPESYVTLDHATCPELVDSENKLTQSVDVYYKKESVADTTTVHLLGTRPAGTSIESIKQELATMKTDDPAIIVDSVFITELVASAAAEAAGSVNGPEYTPLTPGGVDGIVDASGCLTEETEIFYTKEVNGKIVQVSLGKFPAGTKLSDILAKLETLKAIDPTIDATQVYAKLEESYSDYGQLEDGGEDGLIVNGAFTEQVDVYYAMKVVYDTETGASGIDYDFFDTVSAGTTLESVIANINAYADQHPELDIIKDKIYTVGASSSTDKVSTSLVDKAIASGSPIVFADGTEYTPPIADIETTFMTEPLITDTGVFASEMVKLNGLHMTIDELKMAYLLDADTNGSTLPSDVRGYRIETILDKIGDTQF